MININNEFLKFMIVGLTNTAISFISFFLLNFILEYQTSYTISYVLGLISSYILNGKWTFSTVISYKGVLLYPVAYLFQFLAGFFTLRLGVDIYQLHESYAYFLSLIISVPIGFFVIKYYFSFVSRWHHR